MMLSQEFSEAQSALRLVKSNDVNDPFCSPNCPDKESKMLAWEFHEAVAVLVSDPDELLVLDPSLFSTPVTGSEWASCFASTVKETVPFTAITDMTPVEDTLEGCRMQLILAVVSQGHWPPFHTCP
jgi:hypothetical protein